MDVLNKLIDLVTTYGLATALSIIFGACLIWITYTVITHLIIPFATTHLDMMKSVADSFKEIRESFLELTGLYKTVVRDIEEVKTDMTVIKGKIKDLKNGQETMSKEVHELHNEQKDMKENILEIKIRGE